MQRKAAVIPFDEQQLVASAPRYSIALFRSQAYHIDLGFILQTIK